MDSKLTHVVKKRGGIQNVVLYRRNTICLVVVHFCTFYMKRCKRSGEEATTSSLRLSLYWNSRTCHESRTRKNKKSQTRICRYYTTNNTVLRSIRNSIFLFLFPLFIPSAVAWLYGIAYWYTKRQGVGLCANICKLTALKKTTISKISVIKSLSLIYPAK